MFDIPASWHGRVRAFTCRTELDGDGTVVEVTVHFLPVPLIRRGRWGSLLPPRRRTPEPAVLRLPRQPGEGRGLGLLISDLDATMNPSTDD